MITIEKRIVAVEFLKHLGNYQINWLHADASFRRYARVFTENKSYILMDAPPDKEKIEPFINIARYLQSISVRVPEIYQYDIANGYILLEDFGDLLMRDYLNDNSRLATYQKAIDILDLIADRVTAKALPEYGITEYMREINIFLDWFPHNQSEQWREDFAGEWIYLLSELPEANTFVLRDYHAQNIMILPNGELGLLDFQDGLNGHYAYDLVSLLEDARLDVDERLEQHFLQMYSDEFIADYMLLGAQRNLKILGIFHRLHKRDGKEQYLQYLPRVMGYLQRNLRHDRLQRHRNLLSFIE